MPATQEQLRGLIKSQSNKQLFPAISDYIWPCKEYETSTKASCQESPSIQLQRRYFWYILFMRFDWDHKNAVSNERKHGVRFLDAVTAFDDPFALRVEDEKHSTSEARIWQIGESSCGVLVVVFTIRHVEGCKVYRIISARKANRRERALYEFNKRVPIS